MIYSVADLSGRHKSSYSGADGNTACVEKGIAPDGNVGVYDSKDPSGPAIGFTPEAWSRFLSELTAPGSPLTGGLV